MGLFSSRTKHVYTPYSMLLYQEMPPLVKQTVAGAVTGNRNVGKDLIANLVNGVLWKANGLYSWAKNNHPWGLPDGYVSYDRPADVTLIAACVQDDIGKPINILFTKRTPVEGGNYLYEVIYTLKSSKKDPKEYTWSYTTNAGGKYPVLDVSILKQDSPYYPIIPIRVANENIGEKGKEHRSKIKQALNYLDIGLDDIYKSIKDSTEESGEEPADDMYVILAVSISASKQASKKYIYKYFKYLSSKSLSNKNDYDYWEAHGEASGYVLPTNKVVIKDSRFAQEIEYDYITTKKVTGSIGKRGFSKVEYKVNRGNVPVNSGSNAFSGYYRTTAGVVIQHQLDATTYEEVYVHGLLCRTQVVGSKWVDVSLKDAFDNPESPQDGQCFLLPLHKDVCEQMGPINTHDLMYESIRLYSNDHQTYKLKWYQTGLFKIFVVIVLVVITVVTKGATTPLLSAAMAGLVLKTVVMAVLIMPTITTLVQDLLGAEMALLIAVLATAFGASIDTTPTGITVTTDVSALSVANAGIQGVSGISSIHTQKQLIEYGNEIKGLQEELDTMYEDAARTGYNVAMVTSAIQADSYALLEPSTYVKRALMEPKLPTMIGEQTLKFVDISRYLDTSSTVINLGHS